MTRVVLPNRRGGVGFDLTFQQQTYHVMVGEAGGAPIEVFVSAKRSASMLEALARDAAIVISLALQHGAPLAELRAAVTRGDRDDPATVIGAVLDAIS